MHSIITLARPLPYNKGEVQEWVISIAGVGY